ncbi:Transcriptional regulatory protein, C terminal [Rhizobium sp. RU35A]|uniref:winged helix-turn-helix domain-containing protein n=1 Tax=Rhizobium sp. RU35A TaxID=1907414 RepID=UPI000953AD18|nr:winged helix-turn-helix domain-containing protein [Rhizobium sp. RU35A]SIQ24369.1 Transcriptional regulatory protein, C terminal [Rhizobium sp. RU35A]
MTSLFCPCCGQQRTDYSTIDLTRFTNLERRLIEALVATGQRFQDKNVLADKVYSDRPDGGPLAAPNSIQILIHKAKKKLASSGWTIENRWGCGYRLVRTSDAGKAVA